MTLIGDWMDSHAIDRRLAYSIGLRGKGNTLSAPYRTAAGSTFHRRRTFPDGDWMQPKGIPLCCWWPLGRAYGVNVLVCEGEGDALAAASILDKTDHPSLNGLCPVGLPGVGAVKVCAAELSAARTRHAYICLDADDAGRRATDSLCVLLSQVGVTPFPIELPEGDDLAKWLVRADLGLADLKHPYLPLAVPPVPVQFSRLLSAAEPRTYVPPREPPRAVRSQHTAPDGDVKALRAIPAPQYVAELAEIEQPATGSLIHCFLPDHDDKTPSCRVSEKLWWCHGCQRGGDIFTFARELWECDFPTAKERLLEVFSVEQPMVTQSNNPTSSL